ncbi:MAG: GDP-mannose 4,6-dehydratase [Acidobacteria bacterium]|nr:GDP-mannose 4,6-dehydratase [Acidobacteriota bacterium]
MRTLITGGAGFIGSHVAERLLGEGQEVAIIDDLNDYYDPRLKRQNLAIVAAIGPIAFYRGDIRDADLVGRAFQEFRPDNVVHLAARAGVRPSLDEAALYTQVNCVGTVNLLEAARTAGVKEFVFASSSSVYGVSPRVPFRESETQLQPISPYAGTKLAGEQLALTYSLLYGLKVICLRFFTVYGPRQRPDLAIRKFIQCVEEGRELPFYGDGSMGRDYTYISDTVDGIMAALHLDRSFDIFNLGHSSPVSLQQMVAEIERATGKQARLKRLPVPPGDVPLTYADLTKSEAALGYRPRIEFREGIQRMVEWYRHSVASSNDTVADLLALAGQGGQGAAVSDTEDCPARVD